MPRRVYTYSSGYGFETWNFWSTIGAYLTMVAMLVFLWNVITSLRDGKVAGADPWDARTLEWSIASPPPEYNFAKLPQVEARDDFWHKKYETKAFQPDPEHAQVHLPNPSIWPLVCGFGVLLLAAGVIFNLAISVVGAAVILVSAFLWSFQPFED